MALFLTELAKRLTLPLPGAVAHRIMDPRPDRTRDGQHGPPPVESAVLLLLVPRGDEWVIPFIRRTPVGKYHGGQIGLPGGKTEKSDADNQATALRECQEEIGVCPGTVTILGQLSEVYIPLSNFNITPFIGTIPEMPNFALSKNEVEKVIIIPLKELLNDKNKTTRLLYREGKEITAPGYKIGENFIWGATAMIIAELEYIMKQE